MADASAPDWTHAIDGIAEGAHLRRLGARHVALYTARKPQLLVTFETAAQAGSDDGALAADLAAERGWTHLRLISDGETWFRAPELYAYFDELLDEDLFGGFEMALFTGSQDCAYAAAAYSVAAPGARVLLFAPRATGDPRRTGWDDRLRGLRRTDFTSRFGYAPDMLDAAAEVFLIYDPSDRLDAMHAALMMGPNAVDLPVRRAGPDPARLLTDVEGMRPLLLAAMTGALEHEYFAEIWRRRRRSMDYYRRLLRTLGDADRPYLLAHLASHVATHMQSPRFMRIRDELLAREELAPLRRRREAWLEESGNAGD